MLFQVIKSVKNGRDSNPKAVFADVTYNQFLAVIHRPCLSFRKEKNRLKTRQFWKSGRKMKGEIIHTQKISRGIGGGS
jgi:hypothetical protein